MQTKIQVFKNKVFGEVRTMTNERGETFFVGKDVAQALGYAKPENALATHVDKEDKTTTLIQGTGSNYKSKIVVINESGMYSLILSSKLRQAKAFKRWVTSEVLPAISAVVAILAAVVVHLEGGDGGICERQYVCARRGHVHVLCAVVVLQCHVGCPHRLCECC